MKVVIRFLKCGVMFQKVFNVYRLNPVKFGKRTLLQVKKRAYICVEKDGVVLAEIRRPRGNRCKIFITNNEFDLEVLDSVAREYVKARNGKLLSIMLPAELIKYMVRCGRSKD